MSDIDLTTSEEFRQIPGVEGYRFSSLGRPQSCWEGHGPASHLSDRWHDIKPTKPAKRKYLGVCIKRNGKRFKTALHPLIAEAFLGPCPKGMECCHKDDNPLNNRIDNLVWGTRRQNMEHRRLNGIQIQGERQWMARLTEADIREIRRLYDEGMTCEAIGARFGVTFQHVHSIVTRQRWRHVI